MAKKLSLLLAAAAVLAFAVPAFASASTGLTEGGALIPTGKIITGTNTGSSVVESTKTGNITCASGTVMAEAKLTTNSLTKVVAEEGGKSTYTATCSSPTGSPVVKNIKIVKLETTGGGTGTASVSFQIELTPGGTVCSYTGTNDAGTYSTTETSEGGNVLSINQGALSVTPVACGTTAKLTGKFSMATQESSTKVYLM